MATKLSLAEYRYPAGMVDFSEACTDPELQCAYGLRFRVLSEEFGDYRWADRERGIYQDTYDTKNAVVLNAYYQGNIVGTVRGVYRKYGEYLSDKPFAFHLLAKAIGKTTEEVKSSTLFITRAAVASDFRGDGICHTLVSSLEEIAKNSGAGVCVTEVAANKIKVQRAFMHMGFRAYQSDVSFTNKKALNPETWIGHFYYKEI